MALSSITPKQLVSENEYGYTIQDHDPIEPGETIPMYIPILMPHITSGAPSSSSVITKGSIVFANDSACMPNAATMVKTQNYVSPALQNNNSCANIIKYRNEEEQEDPYIPSGTRLKCVFTNYNIPGVKVTTNT